MSNRKSNTLKVYPHEKRWKEFRASKTTIEYNKALEGIDEAWTAQGFKPIANGKDENGVFIQFKVKPGTTLQQAHDFLENYNMEAVSLEPGDATALLGKTPITLGLERQLELQGNANLQLLAPDDLAETLRNESIHTLNSGAADSEIEPFIVDDLVATGHLTQQEVDAVDRWSEPEPVLTSPPGYSELGPEWTPDPDYDEWER